MRTLFQVALFFLFSNCAQAFDLQPFTTGTMAQLTQSKQSKIISFWSVDCSACMAEMAILHQLKQRHPKLEVVLVAIDPLEEQDQVKQVLQEHQLTQLNLWQFAATNSQKLRYDVDPNWYGELPRSYFVQPGQPLISHSGVLSLNALERWVKQQQ